METLENVRQDLGNVLFPSDVRKILNTDNEEIKNLCRKVKVYPKKDKKTGKTFFLKNDVEFLMRIKELHERGKKIVKQEADFQPPANNVVEKTTLQISETDSALIQDFKAALEKMIEKQDSIAERIENSLDSKLEGLDEVVVELIQMKTENENLRLKLNQLTKENYDLRKNLEAYKPIGLGLYVK